MGIGHVTAERAKVARNNIVMDVHVLDAARLNHVQRFLFASSACVYPQQLQEQAARQPLREDDAWPADPQKGTASPSSSSRSCASTTRRTSGWRPASRGFTTSMVRLAAMMAAGRRRRPRSPQDRLAETGGTIDVWGDGTQTRSFIYVDDCVKDCTGSWESDCSIPLNLDTGQMVTLDELAKIVADVAGKTVRIRHNQSMPRGARACNSDNALLRHVLGWEPRVS